MMKNFDKLSNVNVVVEVNLGNLITLNQYKDAYLELRDELIQLKRKGNTNDQIDSIIRKIS